MVEPALLLLQRGKESHGGWLWQKIQWCGDIFTLWKDGGDLMVHGAMVWLTLRVLFSLPEQNTDNAEALSQKLDREIPLGNNLRLNICNSL